MGFWKRTKSSQKPRVSIIVVSSNEVGARELRLSRFGYRVIVATFVGGILSMGLLALLSPHITAAILSETAGYPWKAQLEDANRRTLELARELEQMKQITRSIRQLAGVTEFEASSPPPVTEYATFSADGAMGAESLLLSESRLPFVLRDRWIPVDERDIGRRQETLYRSTPSAWPLRGWVTNEFQYANDPLRRRHFGLDIAARVGAPVLASGDGIVIFSDWDQDLGWLVVVEHGYGFTTRYGHNSSLRVDLGDRIHRGQIIALVGNTGRSTAPHLHYEVWMHGSPVNPRIYLPDVLRWDDLLG